jgi:GTP cyclohydrolase I
MKVRKTNVDFKKAMESVRELLLAAGEDPDRKGLRRLPLSIAIAYCRGKDPLGIFEHRPNERGICEHRVGKDFFLDMSDLPERRV